MTYRVTEDGMLVVGLGELRTKTLIDQTHLVGALEQLDGAARQLVVHEDEYPDGPQAPSSVKTGELYPAGLNPQKWGVEYPAHSGRMEDADGEPAWLDWGLVRIGYRTYSLDECSTANALLVECLERGIDPADMIEALESAAKQIRRYARRRG